MNNQSPSGGKKFDEWFGIVDFFKNNWLYLGILMLIAIIKSFAATFPVKPVKGSKVVSITSKEEWYSYFYTSFID